MGLRDRATNVALAGAAFLLSLAAGEVVLRGVVSMPLHRPLPEVRYAPHPVRRFTLLPNQRAFSYGAPVTIGSGGFRLNRSSTGDAAPEATILALGDSFTFGLGVRDEETWPARLETALANTTGGVTRVLNAGTISYGVFQELSLLQDRGLVSRPRIVIHGLYWNDFMNAAPPPPGSPSVVDAAGYLAWDRLSESPSAARQLASRAMSSSALMFAFKQAADSTRTGGNPTSAYGAAYQRLINSGLEPADWQPIERFYDDLLRLSEDHHFVPIVVILPVIDIVGGPAAVSHPYPAAARQLLERLKIRYIDTCSLMVSPGDQRAYFLPQGPDAHLNAAGYRVVARAIAQRLRAEQGLIPSADAKIASQ